MRQYALYYAAVRIVTGTGGEKIALIGQSPVNVGIWTNLNTILPSDRQMSVDSAVIMLHGLPTARNAP